MDWDSLTAAKTADGSIRNWVNSSKVPASEVIAEAEAWLATKLRVAGMLARAELTLALDADEIDLSADLPAFLDPVRAFLRGYGNLEYRHEAEIDRLRAVEEDDTIAAGPPDKFAVVGRPGTMIFDTKADQAYTVILTHYAKPTALSAGNPTNLYTTTYPHIMRLASIGWAYSHLKDESRSAAYLAAAESQIETLAEMDDMMRRGMVHGGA